MKCAELFIGTVTKSVNVSLNKYVWEGIKENIEFEGYSVQSSQNYNSLERIYKNFDSLFVNNL